MRARESRALLINKQGLSPVLQCFAVPAPRTHTCSYTSEPSAIHARWASAAICLPRGGVLVKSCLPHTMYTVMSSVSVRKATPAGMINNSATQLPTVERRGAWIACSRLQGDSPLLAPIQGRRRHCRSQRSRLDHIRIPMEERRDERRRLLVGRALSEVEGLLSRSSRRPPSDFTPCRPASCECCPRKRGPQTMGRRLLRRSSCKPLGRSALPSWLGP